MNLKRNIMKKLLLLLTILLLPKVSVASNPTQGMCGPAVYWSYDSSTHILKITGQGTTWGYTGNDTPWRKLVGEIHEVIIEGYMQELGNYLFWNCYNLTKVTIPSSVTTICNDVFGNCTQLSDVYCYAENVPTTWSQVFYNVNLQNATLHVPNASINSYRNTEPWSGFGNIVGLNDTEYMLSYILDGSEYKSYSLCEGQTIIPEPDPIREGYTFSGWSEIPEVMPAHDVTVIGSMTVNKYKLIYKVNGEEYKSYDVEYGTSITPEPALVQEGYTFSGWSEIPETMPAHDVTITGSFTINKYILTYKVDGEVYKTYEVNYGTPITPEPELTEEGYTFSGWSEIPETMPAHDVTVSGTFTINTYKLIYMVDGEVYKSYDVEYGSAITPELEPTKEGYSFSGWSEIPETMPANDVTVTGSFAINKYKITYIVDGNVVTTQDAEYGSTIVPPATDSSGNAISWNSHPTTMPAYDITIYGSYITGIDAINYNEGESHYYSLNGEHLEKPRKGINIVKMSDGTVKKVVVK